MTEVKKVVALTGSTRGLKTASEAIINYVEENLKDENIKLIKYRVFQVFDDKDKTQELINELKQSELILICSPVYVHSLPYPLISLMEKLSGKTDGEFWKNKKIMAIIHNGYPQAIQRKASLAICENFAEELGIEWLGGIGFGGTPIIDGRPLEKVGRFTKWMRKALDDLSNSIVSGQEISREAQEYADKHFPSIPLWILKIMMNLRARSTAKKAGVDLYAQPYFSEGDN